MKTLVTVLAVVAMVALAASAYATTFWTEAFNYSDGALATVSGGLWTIHSGSGTDIQVVSKVAVGNNANAPDDNRTFTAQDTNATTYACFQVMIPTPTTKPVVNGYFAHFKDTGTFNFMGRLYVLPVTGQTSNFTFGVSVYSSSTAVPPTAWASALNFDTWYWVVIAYNSGAKSATLWVNPQSPLSTSIVSTTSSGTIPKVATSAFALRQSSSGSPATGTASWTYKVDNLGVGTSFYDACAFTGVTPTHSSSWGQVRKIYK